MKKFLSLLLSAVLCLTLLTGCGKDYASTDSTIFILKNGKVICTDVAEFDSSRYSEEEFETYVEEAIAAYTAEYGKKSVSLKSVTFADGICTLTISYASADDFSRFTGYTLFIGSTAEALAAGYNFDGDFAVINDGTATACSYSDVISATGYTTVVLDAAYNVNVYGTIAYTSANNVSLVDKNTIKFAYGNNVFGSNADADTEDTEAGEPVVADEEDTETVNDAASAGSVDDDEWEVEEEEEVIPVFDFSEADTSSDVVEEIGTAYIIFK